MELVKKEEKAFFMPSLVEPDQSCNVFCWAVHPIRLFVRFQTCKHSISKMSANWHKWSTGQGHETSILVVMGSKVRVRGGQSLIWRPGGGTILDCGGSCRFVV